MNNQSKFQAAVRFIIASCILFNGLESFTTALSYDGLENNFLADNWGTPLVILLIVLFGLGWWFENLVEYLVSTKGRTMATLAFIGIVLIFGLIELGSLMFIARGFFRFAMIASGYTLMSGFSFRFSAIRPEVITKLRERN